MQLILKQFTLVWILLECQIAKCADVVMNIPDTGDRDESASYRVFYTPPSGSPPPNATFLSKDIGKFVLSNALPGTNYDFTLYYSNSTINDAPTYKASITTAPDPPANIFVSVINDTANVTFEPPRRGNWQSFILKIQLRNGENKPTNISLTSVKPYIAENLTPGGSYLFQLFTEYEKKLSVVPAEYSFTTRPNTPVKSIVWFRNETTLKLLWQAPPSHSIFLYYKAKIVPGDGPDSEVIVDKGDEPPGPAQAIFRELVPGRPYNISVQAVSDNDTASLPTFAQYRTTPLPPANLQVDPASVTISSFKVSWDPPDEITEFDKYLISINVIQPNPILPLVRNKTDARTITFNERLLPGHTYLVSAMTVSGKVNSADATTNVTLKPLPVKNLKAVLGENGHVKLTWRPDNSSSQQSYEISYTEVYNGSVLNGDTNFLVSTMPEFILESLLPGRNYSIGVKAVSHKSQSSSVITFQATKPSPPVIEELKPIEFGLNISWKSDVNSRQEKFEIFHLRNDSDSKLVKNITKENHILLDNLYPGAGYYIKIFAISHGLKSEPHNYFQAVYPKPPTNLRKIKITSNSLSLTWDEPKDTLFSEFSIRSRTENNSKWTKNSVTKRSIDISDLMPGEHYLFQINTVSFGVESARPLIFNHTVYPSPVTSIASLIDSTNVTIEFPRPEGHIEYYIVKWMTIKMTMTIPIEQKTKYVKDFAKKGERVRILIDDLIPGVKYQFDLQTSSFNLTSNPTTFVAPTVPLILSELVVVSNVQEPGAMTIWYTPTPLNSSQFDRYRFNLSDVGYVQEKLVDDPDKKVTFADLTPGKLYKITVWTVSDDVLSQPLYRNDRLYPEPVTQVQTKNITDTHVTLVWDKPKGVFDSYEVQYLNSEGFLVQNLTTEEICTIDNLKPYKNYTFTVIVQSGNDSTILRRSSSQSIVFETKEGIPGMVSEFHPTSIHPREINFEWMLPESQWNGILKRFIIAYNQEGFSETVITEFSPKDTSGSIKDLLPGQVYTFKIKAETKVGFGPETSWKEEMPILAPPKPSSTMVPTEVYRKSSTIQIRFRKNYFSDENGVVVSYTIIVAEDDSKNTSGIEMPSWADVQGYETWPPYQVQEPYFPFKNSTVEDFTIGTENCDNSLTGYCNGPLKSGTYYRVKIRAFTTPSKFVDTEYSFSIQTDRNWPHILAFALIPCGILICGVIVFFVLANKYKIIGKKSSCDENLNLSDCRPDSSKPVPVDKFVAYYGYMSADSDFRFSEEFEKLKLVGKDLPTTFADLPCNRPKNRFTNILPFDHSRYKLQPVDDEEGSDYINANYIPGYNSPREFIVTQGPLHSTKDDFWRMCWESNSMAIVMLTRCFEKGREKCDHYWPEDTNPVTYGDISVTFLNESRYSNWCITEMMLQRGDTQRIIRHFHFTTWPDFGVPNPPTILIKFVKAFRNRISNEPRPIIVHCSAGVGRSGTFIAIDRILQALNNDVNTIDIFGIVNQMRKERVLMVQTEQQYICIHQCLVAVLQGCENQSPQREDHRNMGYEELKIWDQKHQRAGQWNDNDAPPKKPKRKNAENKRPPVTY